MNISTKEATQSLSEKLTAGLETLKSTQKHLDKFKKDTEASVGLQLKTARAGFRWNKQGFEVAICKVEEIMAIKKEESIEVISEWKAKHEKKKLEKRAARAEEYAEACVTLALCYAGQAEIAILEAITARQDAISASR